MTGVKRSQATEVVTVHAQPPIGPAWQGKTVYTGAWKQPVDGPAMARRLNIDGDGQGDLHGHGGEQRAVLVYQIGSYRHWERHFGRDDFGYGQFGENLTVDGLPDDEVCVGDRYRIGEAEFEVTQPRVTCYRVGLRTDPARIHTELFGTLPSINPGLTGQDHRPPHQPPGPPGTGPLVTFARSGISVPYPKDKRSVLELARACDVPTRWSCRTGVCHTCVTPLLSGKVAYSPEPLELPADGDVLICCARPGTDIVPDM
jgi:ferredoxin